MSLLDDLVSYWPLNESSGTRFDVHSTNDLAETSAIGSASGKLGNAADFEFDDSRHLYRADNADLSVGNADFTVSFWMKPESNGSGMIVLAKDDIATSREWSVFYASGPIQFFVFPSATSVTGPTLSVDTWYHVVCWHDSVNDVIEIAVNAGTPDTTSYADGITDGTAPFSIGSNSLPSAHYDGLVDEVGFWKRVLTSQERTDLYNAGAGLDYDNFGGGPAGEFLRPVTMTGGMLVLCGGLV